MKYEEQSKKIEGNSLNDTTNYLMEGSGYKKG